MLRLLDYLEEEAPVAMGYDQPLDRQHSVAEYPVEVHGNDGMGDCGWLQGGSERGYCSGVEAFIEENIRSGARTIVATGRLTNLARVFQANEGLAKEVEEI